jgi:hypothetical protein
MMQQVLQNLRNQEGQKEMTYIFKCWKESASKPEFYI